MRIIYFTCILIASFIFLPETSIAFPDRIVSEDIYEIKESPLDVDPGNTHVYSFIICCIAICLSMITSGLIAVMLFNGRI
jgi:hypothetical protein